MPLIVEMLHKSIVLHSDKPALRAKVAGRWVDHSYRELWRDSDQIAAGLEQWGLAAGDRAALLASSSPAWVKAYVGILKANGTAVPIDKELKRGELRHILTDSAAKVLFTEEPYLETVLDIAEEIPALEKIILLNPPPPANGCLSPQAEGALAALVAEWQRLSREYHVKPDDSASLESLAEAFQKQVMPKSVTPEESGKREGLFSRMVSTRSKNMPRFDITSCDDFQLDAASPEARRNEHDPAVILYTSGTTGRAKGAMLSHNNITSNVLAAIQAFELTPEMHTLSFLPINHVFEQVAGMLLPLTVGGTISFAESLRKIGDNLSEVKPNFLLGVPAVFRMLADRMTNKIENKTLSKMLFAFPPTKPLITKKIREAFGGNPVFISGGAALDPVVAAKLLDLGLHIYQGYGITETSPVISVETPSINKLGTTGKPLPGIEVKIHQPNADGIGEIWAKGPNIMLGYFNNPEATAEILTDGWYHTGDLGCIDDEGLISICGRLKNLIVTANGKNVYPEEIENELLNSPFIAEVMVYGHKVDGVSEDVHAMIYPDHDAIDAYTTEQAKGAVSHQEVEGLIRKEVLERGKQLADYKRVKRFTLRNDEFPKTTTRKIKRFAVEADIETES